MFTKDYWQKWHETNRPIPKHEIQRKYYQKNKEEILRKKRETRHLVRDKINASKKAWDLSHPDHVALQRARKNIKDKNTRLRASLNFHYKITIEEYRKILLLQNGLCLICGNKNIKGRTKRLCVDHNHTTGDIRALLCYSCNAGLGYFFENTSLMIRAMQYIRFFNKISATTTWSDGVRLFLQKHGERNA